MFGMTLIKTSEWKQLCKISENRSRMLTCNESEIADLRKRVGALGAGLAEEEKRHAEAKGRLAAEREASDMIIKLAAQTIHALQSRVAQLQEKTLQLTNSLAALGKPKAASDKGKKSKNAKE